MKKRIPISVEVIFGDDGAIIPKKLFYKGRSFEIEKLIGIRRYCPPEISCISPIEFNAVICGLRRKIYYEQSTNKWFSIKEYKLSS
ncbi:MAG: hypothetical protein J1G01_01615 [Clostridiales bacterium]|nr:hypothetical protein [Clostridiales bacterium]